MSTFATIIIDNNTQNNILNDTMNKTYFVLILQVWCKCMSFANKLIILGVL
jgi:hypothetical protein